MIAELGEALEGREKTRNKRTRLQEEALIVGEKRVEA